MNSILIVKTVSDALTYSGANSLNGISLSLKNSAKKNGTNTQMSIFDEIQNLNL